MNRMRFPLRRDILNKDVPEQEPRRPFGRAIDNKVIHLSFNRLPHSGLDTSGDTRIWHAGLTQKQVFGSCANRNTPIGTHGPSRSVLTFYSFRSKFHPDLASSTSHVDDAQESLRALQESADAFPNPYLKSTVSGVSALWQTAKVEQCVNYPQRYMFYQNL